MPKGNAGNKKFNPSFIMNRTRKGNGATTKINAAMYDQLIEGLKVGASFYVEELTEEQVDNIKSKSKYPDSQPAYRLVLMPPQEKRQSDDL